MKTYAHFKLIWKLGIWNCVESQEFSVSNTLTPEGNIWLTETTYLYEKTSC